MLRAALALLSTLQVGARIRESFERSLRQAIAIAIAALLLLAAAVFALVAAYHALVSIYHFDPAEAAAIMAAGLLLVGLIVLTMVPRRLNHPSDLPLASGAKSQARAK